MGLHETEIPRFDTSEKGIVSILTQGLWNVTNEGSRIHEYILCSNFQDSKKYESSLRKYARERHKCKNLPVYDNQV